MILHHATNPLLQIRTKIVSEFFVNTNAKVSRVNFLQFLFVNKNNKKC